MSRTVLRSLSLRSAFVAGSTALLVGLPSLPAWATTAPAAPTTATASVGAYLLDLAWSGGGGTGAVVRDVTGLSGTLYPNASGRAVPTTSATTARDTGFRNVGTATYAIWSTESDGTPSDAPLVQDVPAVPAVPTSLTLGLSATLQRYGVPVAVTGTLTRAGAPLSNQVVDLYARTGGTTTALVIRHLRTAADGTVSTTILPRYSMELGLRFPGDAFSEPSSSPLRIVRIQPRITARLVPSTILLHQTSVLTGQAVPAYAGARVVVQQHIPTGWRSLAAVSTSSTGTYRYAVSPNVGVYSYRVILSSTAAWMQAVSPVAGLQVNLRDLYSGLHGADVLALQKRLAALHYDVGAVDGVFGYNLTHAVIAFQKVERLSRTGRWTKVERARVLRPTAWRLRYRTTGLAVEVDITRQVLVLSRAGVVLRIVDVSTGSERVYYQDGVRNIAHTPRGRFAITHKIDGIRISKLGSLYRPAYFFQGYAIHGNGSVPVYPASHGCVRVTDPVMDRLFPIFFRGMPVSVYDE